MSEGRREGERRQHAPQSVCTLHAHERSYGCSEDASFARSFDPCTSILTMHSRRKSRVVGRTSRHHGWANPGNREEPTLGSTRTDGARLAACHRFRKGEGVARQKRKEVEASVPARIEELGFGCPHVEVQLQKSVGDVWSRISSANALQKERTGSSEQGPSTSRSSAGETVGGYEARNARRESSSPVKTGEHRRKAQSGERSPFSGVAIAKSGACFAGPGL
jgi:hypothetical protein